VVHAKKVVLLHVRVDVIQAVWVAVKLHANMFVKELLLVHMLIINIKNEK